MHAALFDFFMGNIEISEILILLWKKCRKILDFFPFFE